MSKSRSLGTRYILLLEVKSPIILNWEHKAIIFDLGLAIFIAAPNKENPIISILCQGEVSIYMILVLEESRWLLLAKYVLMNDIASLRETHKYSYLLIKFCLGVIQHKIYNSEPVRIFLLYII
jgi:hypothetical protein